MEEKINIAAILNDKPNGLRLYSPIFGECTYCYIHDETGDICVKKRNGVIEYFNSEGLYYVNGEVMLFPSKSIRDWEKFSWKRGDVLISDCGFVCIFKEWASDDYTRFNGCYFDGMQNAPTAKYSKLDNNTAYGYIRELEKRCGGVLNIKTLKIEKNPEFKDGDIVALVVRKCTHIAIFQSRQEAYIGFHAVLFQNDELLLEEPFREDVGDIELRLATDSEKQQLFDALAKKGKVWDAEKKQIVDLKQKVELKPFDKVLCRNSKDDTWEADFFARLTRKEIDYTQSGKYLCVGNLWMYCIPYNEETAHLLGTTDEWKGGEG